MDSDDSRRGTGSNWTSSYAAGSSAHGGGGGGLGAGKWKLNCLIRRGLNNENGLYNKDFDGSIGAVLIYQSLRRTSTL